MVFNKNVNFNSRSGITLVELLVTLFLLSIVLGGIYEFYVFGQRSITETSLFAQVQQKVTLFTTGIRREVVSAKSVDGLAPVEAANSGRDVNIYTDVDWDGMPELVQYGFQGTSLQRRVVESTTATAPYNFARNNHTPTWTTVLDRVKKLKDPHPEWFFYVETAANGKNGRLLTVDMSVSDADQLIRDPIDIKMQVITRGVNSN